MIKRLLMVFLFVFSMLLITSCGKEGEFGITEITQLNDETGTYYMKIDFVPKNIGRNSVLERIHLGNIEIKDAYLIDYRNNNTPEEYKKRRIASLPIDIKNEETYSVVVVSEDKRLFAKEEIEEIDFSYKTGSKNLIYTDIRK